MATMTKTLRFNEDLYKDALDILDKTDQFGTQQEIFNHLLRLGIESYLDGAIPIESNDPGEQNMETEMDDRLSFESLQKHIQNAQRGLDEGLYDIADVNVLRIYQKQKDIIEKDFNLSEDDLRMNILIFIERFYTRYSYLRYIFYQNQLYHFPFHILGQEDSSRYHFIFILDHTGNISLKNDQDDRIRGLFSVYKTLGIASLAE